eukprot:CAMPEP_0116847246 /NCGR_PEP_ID=MMETSP0418-20121206/14328_1 /TAXON_ID=1158023 /ORGANISM="Astrosyne radiata, Strain 13vi08-1A" /LENGTH=493 /DNA_ID=CAMNT_0004478671 /DNA_START=96 /DNA_END=1577 /DNA_ORIENTATION=+
MSHSNPAEIITSLNANDVLFGRGSGPNDHEGNIRFRALVGERKAEYMATNHRQTKAKIARDIVNTVLSKHGRFLKKVEPAEAKRLGIPKGVDAWCVVDDETIMEKAKQALRQQRDKGRNKSPTRSQTHSPKNDVAAVPIQVESFVPNLDLGKQNPGIVPGGGYPGAAPQIQPNPYEPIPIGGTLTASEQGLDWKGYAAAAIAAQAPNLEDYNPAPQPVNMPPQAAVSAPPQAEERGPDRDLQRRGNESIQVMDLMDSFNKMKTKELEGDDAVQQNYASIETMGTISSINNKNDESTDTMGTIEPLPVAGRDSGYTNISLTSSTLSLMKTALGDSNSQAAQGQTTTIPPGSSADAAKSSDNLGESPAPARGSTMRSGSVHITDKDFFVPPKNRNPRASTSVSDLSLSLSHVMSERRKFVGGPITEGSEEHSESKNKKGMSADPRPLGMMEDEPDNMSGLGKSSMSILHMAMGESGQDSGMMTAAHESIFSDLGD